jgi:hypothetical protein
LRDRETGRQTDRIGNAVSSLSEFEASRCYMKRSLKKKKKKKRRKNETSKCQTSVFSRK